MNPRIKDYIARAQALGSKAKTLQGAGKWIIQNTVSVFDRRGRRAPRVTPQQRHNDRLIARYATARRLPKYLTPGDRQTLQTDAMVKQIQQFRTVPRYVQAFFISDRMRSLPELAAEIRRADREKGALTSDYGIALDAERRHDWGRLRVHRPGSCVAPQAARVRETGSNWDWNKRSTLERHADYCYIEPREHGKQYSAWYRDSDGRDHTVRYTERYMRIDQEKPTKRQPKRPKWALSVHSQRRILEVLTPAVLAVEYDRERRLWVLSDATREHYHFGCFSDPAGAREAIRNAVEAFRKRREEKIATARLRSRDLFIDLEDSYRSGNCKPMSDEFARRVWQAIGAAGPCAVRADVVLGIRDDSYTRRAAMAALTR